MLDESGANIKHETMKSKWDGFKRFLKYINLVIKQSPQLLTKVPDMMSLVCVTTLEEGGWCADHREYEIEQRTAEVLVDMSSLAKSGIEPCDT
jgi:hypothetical protein